VALEWPWYCPQYWMLNSPRPVSRCKNLPVPENCHDHDAFASEQIAEASYGS